MRSSKQQLDIPTFIVPDLVLEQRREGQAGSRPRRADRTKAQYVQCGRLEGRAFGSIGDGVASFHAAPGVECY